MWQNNRPGRDDNPYYSVLQLTGDGMEALRQLFPEGEANDLNAALFSTSGVHGTYATIEDVERGGDEPCDVTFVVIQPRIVCMRYGNVEPKNPDDFAFLKKLRASSLKALAGIGMPPMKDEKRLHSCANAFSQHPGKCGAWCAATCAPVPSDPGGWLAKARAALAQEPAPATTPVQRLAAFGAWCAREFRDSLSDVDGGSAQDAMARLGVIVKHTVTEPCGEGCVCAEYGDFPHECYKFPPDVDAAIRARTKDQP